jgi:hypothetical protein
LSLQVFVRNFWLFVLDLHIMFDEHAYNVQSFSCYGLLQNIDGGEIGIGAVV